MHNGPIPQQAVLGRPPAIAAVPVTPPPAVPTFYAAVKVTDPLLIPGQALFGNAPHWSYQIATTLQPQGNGGGGMVWLVRRRFRHVVALEDRLREECPGAVLPPRYVSRSSSSNVPACVCHGMLPSVLNSQS